MGYLTALAASSLYEALLVVVPRAVAVVTVPEPVVLVCCILADPCVTVDGGNVLSIVLVLCHAMAPHLEILSCIKQPTAGRMVDALSVR